MRKARRLIPLFATLLGVAGCSSAPSGPPAAPPWVHQPARTVDSGYIVYVGTGEDYTPERAAFKAEASAIQDIANECSFAPKGTRVEDHYNYFYEGKYQSFVQVAVGFDDCDQAKQALNPAQVQELANATMTEQLKHYQEIEYEMPGEGSGAEANPSLADTNTAPPGSSARPATSAVPAINDDGVYFVARQQVAYAKEIVILNPAGYPAGSPQSQQFVTQIRPQQNQIQQYEQVHPLVRTWGNSWSSFERNPTTQLPASIPRPRGYSSGGMGRGYGSGSRQGNAHPPGARRRRKRRRYGEN